ncbi:MAG: xanthine dehydrogenase family protein molybdopterin-binding subunit [Cyclobacteriaceae bacterium]|nr:xanthine dehydrogenase family protein molybdopterin-binding subunit [Cyclobacteriaceae bacterium]
MTQSTKIFSRRDFIKVAGMTGSVLALGFAIGCEGKKEGVLTSLASFDPATAKEFTPFILIDSKGTILIYNHKPEMGQGTFQSMPLIVAEELGVTLDQVVVQNTVVDKRFGNMSVGGSYSVRGSWKQLREAGAAARQMLIEAAAAQWKVNATECDTQDGKVIHTASGKSATFGELVTAAAQLPVPKEVKLRDPSTFRVIGKSVRRPDIINKVNGTAQFGIDVKLPGMLYASIERSPVFHGKVKSFDDSETRKVPGVKFVQVVERNVGLNKAYGVAVLADNYFAAYQGRLALKVEWDNAGVELTDSDKLYERFRNLTRTEGMVAHKSGDFAKAYAQGAKKVEALYELPFASHAPMEPQNAVAHVTDTSCEVWAPTQVPDEAFDHLVKFTGLPPDSVKMHFTFLGGGFGRRLLDDYISEAAFLSKSVKAPVKVIWTREDDMTIGPFRPGTVSALKASLDAQGNPLALQHKVVAPSIMYSLFGAQDPNHKEDSGAMEGIADSPYEIPNVSHHNIYAETSVPILWWRSVYSATTAFAHECFIDEMAHAAGKDPIDFRLGMINKNTKMKNLLLSLREKSGWDKPLPEGWAKGVAIWQFFAGQAGHVVYVSKQGNGVKVERVVAVIDCGLVVNPDNVKPQVEGGSIMALSAAVKDETTFKNGMTVQKNFNTYRMSRINDSPPVEVHMMPGGSEPEGVGEPGLPPLAPALGNAIFALTGKRHRKLPIDLGAV